MSKKLIAVASAAALALSALVAIPAAGSVGPFQVTEADSISANDGSTKDLEHTILVPSANVVRYDAGVPTTNMLVQYTVTTPVAGDAVSAVAAGGGAKLVTQAQVTAGSLTSASGALTASGVSDTAGQYVFYAFTTSTADSTITVTSGSNSAVFFIKGVSDKSNGYKLNFTATNTSTAPSGLVKFSGTVTDAFGNIMTGILTGDLVLTGIGGDLGAAALDKDEFDQDAITGVITFETANRDSVGPAAMSLAMGTGLAAAAGAPTKVTAFGDPIGTQFFTATAVDLAAQVTALTAQVAALQVIVARKVTKKRYNTLARKWNRAFPSQKVWVKP